MEAEARSEAKDKFQILILFLVVFLFVFVYVRMNVQTALLRREILGLQRQKERQEKRNRALREEVSRVSGPGKIQEYYRQKYGVLPLYEQNTIVSIRFPPGFAEKKHQTDSGKAP